MEVAVDKTTHQFLLHVHSKGKFSEQFGMDNDLIHFLLVLQDKTPDYLPDKFLQICTDHKRNDQIFRGHPNFRGKGTWKDWVVVDWGHEGKLPSHISCFVDLRNLNFEGKKLKYEGVYWSPPYMLWSNVPKKTKGTLPLTQICSSH